LIATQVIGESWRVTVTASAAGTRIDCDHCGQHVASRFLLAENLRRVTDYVRLDGADHCPRCALRRTPAPTEPGAHGSKEASTFPPRAEQSHGAGLSSPAEYWTTYAG
jgi:hypothetical protein